MRAGVPVVLSDVVGNRDTVEHGATGFLVPFGDADAASRAIITLLDDREVRAAIIGGATDRLRRDFDVHLMGQRLAALYAGLASGAPSSGATTTRAPSSGATTTRASSSRASS
jgi:glycosyltransferase involved in cell wall biosynthesis